MSVVDLIILGAIVLLVVTILGAQFRNLCLKLLSLVHEPEPIAGELVYRVQGDWRFAVTDDWKPYTFDATATSADARLVC
jgi:hypothetical protein